MVQLHDEYQITDSFWELKLCSYCLLHKLLKDIWLPIVWTRIIYLKNYWTWGSFSSVPFLNLKESRNSFSGLGRRYASIFLILNYLFGLWFYFLSVSKRQLLRWHKALHFNSSPLSRNLVRYFPTKLSGYELLKLGTLWANLEKSVRAF